MTWEISVVAATLFVPPALTYMVTKTFEDDNNPVYFYLKLALFIVNLYIIAAGLWIGKVIASLNDTTIEALMQKIYISYMWFATIISIIIILLIIFNLAVDAYNKFPSIGEKN